MIVDMKTFNWRPEHGPKRPRHIPVVPENDGSDTRQPAKPTEREKEKA